MDTQESTPTYEVVKTIQWNWTAIGKQVPPPIVTKQYKNVLLQISHLMRNPGDKIVLKEASALVTDDKMDLEKAPALVIISVKIALEEAPALDAQGKIAWREASAFAQSEWWIKWVPCDDIPWPSPSDEDEEFRDAQSVVNKRLTEQSLSLTDGEEDYTTVQTKQIEWTKGIQKCCNCIKGNKFFRFQPMDLTSRRDFVLG